MQKVMQVVIASVETRNFTFEGYGFDDSQALQALEKVLQAHRRQCSGRVTEAWVINTLDDATVRTVETGTGYRDREEVTG